MRGQGRREKGKTVTSESYPILEFDPASEAVIEPSKAIGPADVSEHCVVCFFHDVLEAVTKRRDARVVKTLRSEMGDHPLYEMDWSGRRLAAILPGIGAPFAAALVEEVIATGCRKFIACGAAGTLRTELTHGHLVVPTSAVRDEGTSYHYMPPGREAAAGPEAVAAIEATLKAHGLPYVLGKTWTTDAFYRETPGKVKRRRGEGCLTVEMEAAALFAVAAFRRVTLAQILYAADDVSGDEWDSRLWHTKGEGIREQVFDLAAEACLRL